MKLPPPAFRKARIEIIPMIDTIFFLLVFFMISSLSMVRMNGMEVSLPRASAPSVKPPPRLVVTVDKAGNYSLNADKIDAAQLVSALQQRINANPDTVLVVNVDKTRPMQDIITVMDGVNALQKPGGSPGNPVAVLLATEPAKSGG